MYQILNSKMKQIHDKCKWVSMVSASLYQQHAGNCKPEVVHCCLSVFKCDCRCHWSLEAWGQRWESGCVWGSRKPCPVFPMVKGNRDIGITTCFWLQGLGWYWFNIRLHCRYLKWKSSAYFQRFVRMSAELGVKPVKAKMIMNPETQAQAKHKCPD